MISFNPTIAGADSSVTGGPRNELGQKDFLRLMVAQLKNQDPVNPVENNEFLGQIAQFSMVSGIEGLSTSFGGLQSNLFASQAMEAAQMVGKEVLVNDSNFSFTPGQEVSGVIDTSSTLHSLNVNVLSASGDLVRVLDFGSINPGVHQLAWDGLTEDGSEAAEGNYVMEAVAFLDGEPHSLPVQLFQKVTSASVDQASGQVALNLSNNASVPISQIQKIR